MGARVAMVQYRDYPLLSYVEGHVRFTPDKPLPEELVSKLVRAWMAESDARWGGGQGRR